MKNILLTHKGQSISVELKQDSVRIIVPEQWSSQTKGVSSFNVTIEHTSKESTRQCSGKRKKRLRRVSGKSNDNSASGSVGVDVKRRKKQDVETCQLPFWTKYDTPSVPGPFRDDQNAIIASKNKHGELICVSDVVIIDYKDPNYTEHNGEYIGVIQSFYHNDGALKCVVDFFDTKCHEPTDNVDGFESSVPDIDFNCVSHKWSNHKRYGALDGKYITDAAIRHAIMYKSKRIPELFQALQLWMCRGNEIWDVGLGKHIKDMFINPILTCGYVDNRYHNAYKLNTYICNYLKGGQTVYRRMKKPLEGHCVWCRRKRMLRIQIESKGTVDNMGTTCGSRVVKLFDVIELLQRFRNAPYTDNQCSTLLIKRYNELQSDLININVMDWR